MLALLSVPIAVLALAGLFRLTEGALLWMHDQWAWADFLHDPIGFVYLTFGALFSFAGLICWRKGKAPATVPA